MKRPRSGVPAAAAVAAGLAALVVGGGVAAPALAGQAWSARAAPSVGVAAGTSGLGVDAAVRPWDRLGFRVGLGWYPFEVELEEDDFTGTVSPPSPVTRLAVDFFPFRGVFHLSAGLHHYAGGVSGRAVARDSVEVNDRMYGPQEVGQVRARVWGNETAPYLGLGWQRRTGRVQPHAELGVALTGAPRITVDVTGPASSDPAFRQDLDREIRDAEDEIKSLRVFPHLAFGVRVRLGG